jgi:hypothetical protein
MVSQKVGKAVTPDLQRATPKLETLCFPLYGDEKSGIKRKEESWIIGLSASAC